MKRMRNFTKSIMSRLILLYLALVFIVMIVSGIFIYMTVRRTEARNAEHELKIYAIAIYSTLFQGRTGEYSYDFLEMQRILLDPASPIENRSDIDVAILDSSGNTRVPVRNEIVYTADQSIVAALNGYESFIPWRRGVMADGTINILMNYAVPVEGNDGNTYIIFLSMNANNIAANLATIRNTLLLAVLIAMILASILGALFSRTITTPILFLTKTAKEMATGNLRQEVSIESDDEIGQLTESFNNMAKNLDKNISDLLSEKNRIEIIQNNMTDGVLAYDSKDKLIHANYASVDMLGIKNIETMSFKDVMKIIGVSAENSKELDNMEGSINLIDDKYISLNYNSYTNKSGRFDGIVIVLSDVTKHTKLDNMRKEFVANVSHEIRTPLTTIKSYAETLLDGALENEDLAKDFLGVINNEADRITHLASDLLELSRFDNNQLKMEKEVVELGSIISNSIRQNVLLASQKGQTIKYKNPEEFMDILCDPARINQVVNNVLSNAIKYSKENTEISIRTDSTAKHYRVYITDQGVGIPKEDLKRIFERFYRVDKARSRMMGGTGLGLAIAKEIMDAHGGKISAISDLGVGTTMVLRFNKIDR